MNRVPIVFCERVCATSFTGIPNLRQLSGHYGEFARIAYERRADYVTTVANGIEKEAYLSLQCTDRKIRTPEEIEAYPKKLVHEVTIQMFDAKDEKVSQAIVRRFPYACYHFTLLSSSINKAWVDFACSLKRLTYVVIRKKLDDHSVGLFQKLVIEQKLSYLAIYEKAYEGGIINTLKSVLRQEQFKHLGINNYNSGPWKSSLLRDILQLWSKNSQTLTGKHLIMEHNCAGGVKQLEEFILRRPLNGCSKEECDYIEKYYRHRVLQFRKPSCVYKYEEGEGDKRRRLYISFECANEEERKTGQQNRPASHEGLNDLSLMRTTNSLHVLFA
uniref:Uncharacterized protein n=1 Tax=Steinernema glaseri TaxID=37863 RepID=A0A1I7ZZ52_9BILA